MVIAYNPLVSIVILNYNGENYLEDCLNSVLETSYRSFEVILVDNASHDRSLRIVQRAFGADPRLKIVANKENVGFSGGNNIGYFYSKGEYIVFLNNDTIVDPKWLGVLVNSMQNDSTIGLAQSMILNIDGDKIQTAGWLFSSYLGNKYQLFKDKPSNLKLKPVFEVSFVCGACMMVKRELAEEMGVFDTKMPFFYDDTLLSIKTWLAKKRVVTVSGSIIRHVGGATKVWTTKFTTYHLLKSKICLLFDVYPRMTDLSKALLVNAFSISIDSLFCVRNRNLPAYLGSLYALGWSLKNFPFIWQNKLNHWSKAKVSPKTILDKFVRIILPFHYCVLPSKAGADYFALTVSKFEKQLMQA